MHAHFQEIVEALHPKLNALENCMPVSNGKLPREMPKVGIYLFSEDGAPLYVGRSNHIRRRYGLHTRPSADHNQASFAFRIARRETGNEEATYKSGEGSREGLLLNNAFSQAFINAKARVRKMGFQYVEETDDTRQAILEIYCAIALNTPYNTFTNH